MNRPQLKKKLENFGYVFKGERILAGFSRRVKNFSALSKHFHCNWNEKEQVIGHYYTPITPPEARKLQSIIDPVTNEPYVGIAWVKMPWDQFEQKEISALKVVEATEYRNKPQAELEYADDFEEVVEANKKQKNELNKKAGEEAAAYAENDSNEDDPDLSNAPNAEQVDANLEDLPGDEDPLSDMVSDAEGDDIEKKDMSLERAELDTKNMTELRADAKELGLIGFQNLRKDELIEAILG